MIFKLRRGEGRGKKSGGSLQKGKKGEGKIKVKAPAPKATLKMIRLVI